MKVRVLIVEDSRTQAAALADLLENNGYETEIALSGEHALRVVQEQSFDLVLTDVLMPGIDGYEVCRRIKVDLERPLLPVVLLTSLNDPLAIVRGLESGADNYVTKPYDPSRLLARLQQAISNGKITTERNRGKPIDIVLLGQTFRITADKEQILALLVSSYEDLMQTSEAVRTAEQRARFLAEAGELFSASLEPEGVLQDLARMCVPAIGDICIVDVFDEDAWQRVHVTCNPSVPTPLCEALRGFAHHHTALQEASAAGLGGGVGHLIANVDRISLEEVAGSAEHMLLLNQLHLRSVITVPLVARGTTLGSLQLYITTQDRRYSSEDVDLATDLARRAALAVDNARLYRQAQQATRARDDILGIVSHDLRNPLHTIQMAAGLLVETMVDGALTIPPLHQMQVILRSVTRADALIQDLLDVTRIESGHLSVDTELIDAMALIEESTIDMVTLAAEKSLHLITRWEGPSACVNADRSRMGQVFSNLIGNALKFTGPGGSVTVSGQLTGDAISFSVADTGAGIPAESLPHLFDRFWQANRASRAGAGLGLFIAKGIVEAHGGSINVASNQGNGTEFTFLLPRATRSAQSQTHERAL